MTGENPPQPVPPPGWPPPGGSQPPPPGWGGAVGGFQGDVNSTIGGVSAAFQSVGSNAAMTPYQQGAPGRTRPIGVSILLFIVTLGIYGFFWTYVVHEELKSSTRRGMGGLVALLLWIFVAPVIAFTLPAEIEQAYRSRGAAPPVKALTGLWILLPIVGGIVWYVKVQGALNRYWTSQPAAFGSPGQYPQ